MANINVQDVMAAYSPVVEAFDLERGQTQLADKKQMGANTAFDNRIMTEALPITRMLNSDGTANIEAIKGAGKGFSNPYDLWEELQANMPKGRGVDPVVFQEKYAMGKQMYDMNLMNQIGQMDEQGLSEREVRDALKGNPDLYDYALQNQIIPREPESWDWKGIGEGAAKFGVGTAAFYGASRAITSRIPVAPSKELFNTLRESGFERKGKFGVRKISDRQLIQKHGLEHTDGRRKTKKGTPDKRQKPIRGPLTDDSKKQLKNIKAAREKLIKENSTLKKAIGGSKHAGGKILSKPSSITKRGFTAAARAFARSKGPLWARGAAALGGGLLAATAGEKIFDKVFGD